MIYTSPWPHLQIPKCNLLTYLFPHGTTPSDKPLWRNADNPSDSLSQAQMLSWVKRLAMGFDRLGVSEQEAVMVFTPNHLYVPVAYLAAVGSNRCFTGANPVYTPSEVAYQMKAVQAKIVLVHPSLLETGIEAANQAGVSLDRLFLFASTENPTTMGIHDWRSILPSAADADSWQWRTLAAELAVQTTAVINFSSGTTGMPKAVCISHYNLVANSAQVIHSEYESCAEAKTAASETWLAFLPLYHAYSQLLTIIIACKLQVLVYMMPKFSFEGFLESIQRFKITTVHLVPPVLVMMAKRPETAKYDLGTIRHLLSGAAPLSRVLQNEVMNRFGVVVSQAFGMTETTCAAFMNAGGTKDMTGSIGHLLPNMEARLIDEDGRDVMSDPQGASEPGELWLKGPQMTSGYWKNTEATRESISNGWFKTGDVAVTKGQKWWIVDRKKELIKVNGLQVAPAELEAVLLEHHEVADAAVVGIYNHDGEELPRAYVVLKEMAEVKNNRTSEKDIQDFVAGKVAKHKRLQGGVKFVAAVPKLASGKIIRKVLKEWAKCDAKALDGTDVLRARL
jgi:acyl-CoA synthetase (AMP-forming)/AMP-acid ligase II